MANAAPESPLGWLTDLLSRPERAVTNIANQGLNLQKVIGQGKTPGLGDILNVLASPVTGFFSDTPNDQASVSQLLTKAGNVGDIPKLSNPVKGALGFAGDIALDPTTYIPGLDIAGIGSKVLKGGLGILKGAKDLDEAAGVGDAVGGVTADALNPVAAAPSAKILNPDEINAMKPSVAVAEHPNTPGIKQMLSDVQKPTPLPDLTQPLSQDEWLRQKAALNPSKGLALPNGKVHTFSDIGKRPNLANSTDLKPLLDNEYQKYTGNFMAKQAEGKYLRPNGKTVLPSGIKEYSDIGRDTPMDRFARMQAADVGAQKLDDAVGPVSVNFARKQTPKSFEGLMRDTSNIIDGKTNLDAISNAPVQLSKNSNDLLSALGVGGSKDEPNALGLLNQARIAGTTGITDPNVVSRILTAHGMGFNEKDAIAVAQAGFTPAEHDILNTVPKDLHDMFVTKQPYITDNGVERTHNEFGEGTGNIKRFVNQQKQYTLKQSLGGEVYDRVRQSGLTGTARAKWVSREVQRQLDTLDSVFSKAGIPAYIGTDASDLTPLTYGQMYRNLAAHDPEGTIPKVLGNHATAVPDTNIAEAVNFLQRNPDATEDDLTPILKNDLNRNQPRDGTLRGYHNVLNDGKPMQYGTKLNGFGKPEPLTISPEDLTHNLAQTILDSKDDMTAQIARNAADYSKRLVDETHALTDAGLAKVQSFASTGNLANFLMSIRKIPQELKDTATASGASQDALVMATTGVEGAIDPAVHAVASQGDAVTRDALKSGITREPSEAVKKATGDMYQKVSRETEAIGKLSDAQAVASGDPNAIADAQLAALTPEIDVTNKIADNTTSGIHGVMNAFNQMFNLAYKRPMTADLFRQAGVAGQARAENFYGELNNLMKQYGHAVDGKNSVLDTAYRAWADGVTPTDETVAAAIPQLEHFMSGGMMGPDSILGNGALLGGASLPLLEEAMGATGLDVTKFGFDLDAAEQEAEAKGIPVLQAGLNQIRRMPVTDSADFLSKMNNAVERVATDSHVVASYVQHGKSLGLVSDTPKAGFVKAIAKGHSRYYDYLPKGKFYDPDYLREFSMTDQLASMTAPKGPLWDFLRNYYDPMQQLWKFGMTLPRPGHHVRNLIGDSSMTFLARGTRSYMRSVHDSARVLSVSKPYEGYDYTKMLNGSSVVKTPQMADLLSHGKFGDETIADTFAAAMQRGMMPSYRTSEDFSKDMATGRVAEALAGVKHKFAGAEDKLGMVSEARDHFSRMQHFIQYVHQAQAGKIKGIKDVGDMYDKAAMEVRKFHPDGSGLSTFERQVMRRIIPFYSWFRGALPAVIYTAMRHPARILAFPKASYNLAVAMGVNPTSMADPFPIGQVFPSFLTGEETGPQFNIGGHYTMVNPGIAPLDIANVLGQPQQGVGGMLNPVLQLAIEGITGTNPSEGGAPLKPTALLNNLVPGFNYGSNIAGAIGNAASGQLTSAPDSYDQLLSGLNWLTGLGLVDDSKASYAKVAQAQASGNGS